MGAATGEAGGGVLSGYVGREGCAWSAGLKRDLSGADGSGTVFCRGKDAALEVEKSGESDLTAPARDEQRTEVPTFR